MALAERAELVARLSLRDDFSGPLKHAGGSVGKFEKQLSRGFSNASKNIAKIGAVAAAGLGLAIRSGLQSLAELESATTSVQAAIEQMGLAGKITASQVATWANEIEASVGAAFDDKQITQAATTLLRFGKVMPSNLRPALVVMTDLATKTGSIDSAATLLAKALSAPEKAAGKLARSGVILTDVQQKQIETMVKAGKTAEAQAFLLDQLTNATKGAALASQGPYTRALAVLADTAEDAKRALAEGFLPVIERVAKVLSTKLAEPATVARIRGLGKELAAGFDGLLIAAQKIPWATIGDSLALAGQGAKVLFNAFTALPPWVQTAVLTGWGLNKLTGGVLGGIVGELGKGLIKGVLGMNAGVVNINAGVVNGGGGIPGQGGGFNPSMLIPFVGGLIASIGIGQAIDNAIGIPTSIEGTLARVTVPSDTPTQRAIATDSHNTYLALLRQPQMIADALARHAALGATIGTSGGAFLRTGASAKTLDENAGKLVELFRTSTNPSLKSMTDNLAVIKGLAGKGDPATRQKLSDDIKALEAMIAAKLDTLATTAWDPSRGEPNRDVPVNVTVNVTSSITANAVTRTQQQIFRINKGAKIGVW